jgi:hypothetical protein
MVNSKKMRGRPVGMLSMMNLWLAMKKTRLRKWPKIKLTSKM